MKMTIEAFLNSPCQAWPMDGRFISINLFASRLNLYDVVAPCTSFFPHDSTWIKYYCLNCRFGATYKNPDLFNVLPYQYRQRKRRGRRFILFRFLLFQFASTTYTEHFFQDTKLSYDRQPQYEEDRNLWLSPLCVLSRVLGCVNYRHQAVRRLANQGYR